jgi:hypothetical protein
MNSTKARPRGKRGSSEIRENADRSLPVFGETVAKKLGWSRGAVAMNINSGDAKLVLLSPAWKKRGTATTMKPGTVILQSRADDVIPFADSEELVRNSRLSTPTLTEVGSDHRLTDPEPQERMLRACDAVLETKQGTTERTE